ncbi:MAG: DUF192 domain-containing protein [Burkholderiaceae bacterium]|nr:DUF192 domain-containing protein [Burkholderiaceae bacterium]
MPIPAKPRMTVSLWLIGCALATAATIAHSQSPNPPLPKVELEVGIHLIRAEVAADPGTRATGLMYREALGRNEGMLFVFHERSQECFWMKNTRIPLSIAFLADDGRIVSIAEMAPFDETSHCSSQPVRFALEMERGWFARRGISAGQRLRNPLLFVVPPPPTRP